MTCLSLILYGLSVFGKPESDSFVVYQQIGKVFLMKNNIKAPLQTGQRISNDAILSLDSNSLVLLVCPNYQPLRVQRKGLISLKNWSDSCKKKQYSISTLYWAYIWNEFTVQKEKPEKNPKKYMRKKGGFEFDRGCPGFTFYSIYDSINFSKTTTPFIRWQTDISPERLEFVIYDTATKWKGNRIYSKKLTRSSVSLEEASLLMKEDKDYYWTLHLDGNEICQRMYIRKWSDETYLELLDRIETEAVVLSNESSKFQMKGFLLMESNFKFEAITAYKDAYKKDRADERIKKIWTEYKYFIK